MDTNPKERVITWLAMAWRDGEPWEHTAKICETIFRAAILVAAAWCGSKEAGKALAEATAWDFMPKHVRGPKPKADETEEVVKDGTLKFMERAAGITNG